MADYDNTNKGALFNPANQKLIRSGPVDVEGSKENLCIIQTETKSGKTVYEVYQKVGAVFTNDKRGNEKAPDINGSVTMNLTEFYMAGWKKQSKNGNNFTSISLKKKDEQPETRTSSGPDVDSIPDYDDEIPF